MSTIEPSATQAQAMGRSRSRSLSTDLAPTAVPIPMRRDSISSVTSPTSPSIASSSLSASLKAFAELSLSPPTTLESAEFQRAFKHARSTSFSNSTGVRPNFVPDEASLSAALPGMSTSPTSAASDALPTPPSSSPPRQPQQTQSVPGSIGITTKSRNTKGSQLDGVCEKEELEFEGAARDANAAVIQMGESAPSAAPASAALFNNGARWGWPQGGPASTTASTAAVAGTSPPASSLARRPSLPIGGGPGGPGAGRDASAMMAPLGRVVSAGAAPAAPSNSSGKASDGFGLFRRLSVGGFGSRVSCRPARMPCVVVSFPVG